jgi:glycerol-3-phosphate dehydrogenase
MMVRTGDSRLDAMATRGESIEQLGKRRFDLLVIGGGIIGAGIAAEAGRAGLAVALVDQGDFGAATSSASSKLIHGGLRYLQLGDVRLVRESHYERRLLMHVVAPHLVRRLSFLLPLYRDGPYGQLAIQAGLVLYSALARSRLHKLLVPARARDRVPSLRVDSLRTCGVYADAVTHDGRLCLANLRAAAHHGATLLNYADVRELRIVGGRVTGAEVLVDGSVEAVSARTIVNATGPWVDEVRRLENPSASPTVRLSKGSHVLLRLEQSWTAALAIPHNDGRVTFAVPWQDMLLLGTTDVLHGGAPDRVETTEAEVEQILDEASVAVTKDVIRPDAICSTFAGLRVLPLGRGATASARRETVLSRGSGEMLSVAGGKLTTYRRIALAALGALRADLGLHRLDRTPSPLPGAADPDAVADSLARRWPELERGISAHLAHLYGSLAADVLAPAANEPDLLRRLHPDGPDLLAQAVYARDFEWACSLDDILNRRTTLAVRGLASDDTVAVVDGVLRANARASRPQTSRR